MLSIKVLQDTDAVSQGLLQDTDAVCKGLLQGTHARISSSFHLSLNREGR